MSTTSRNSKPKTTPWREIRAKRVKTTEDEARIGEIREQMQAELRLAALRKRRKASQATVAKRLAVSQSSISQLERGADPKLSTIAGYVDALGGRLEVRAVFDDETLAISEIGSHAWKPVNTRKSAGTPRAPRRHPRDKSRSYTTKATSRHR
jgi:transcriptional regulator with XRE-family HTH domain